MALSTARPMLRATLLTVCGILLCGLHFRILILGDLKAQVVPFIQTMLMAAPAYIVASYLAIQGRSRGGFTVVMVVAGLMRLLAWPLYPSLSNDVFRYRWEGMLQAHGGNPYQTRPTDPAWRYLTDSTSNRIPSPHLKAGYGPLLELEERITYQAVEHVAPDPWVQAFWFKLPAALADVLAMTLAALRLRRLKLPLERLLLYAWCPLPVIEFWGMGHSDSILLLFLLIAMDAVESRASWSHAALLSAAAIKLWPLALVPAWFRMHRSFRAMSVALLMLACVSMPYWSGVGENVQQMSGFLGGWRNNESAYSLLAGILPEENAKLVVVALLMTISMVVASLHTAATKVTLVFTVSLLLLSANVHPWYLTWFAILLPFEASAALLLWISLMPLSYDVLIQYGVLGRWVTSTPVRAMIYLPVYGMLAWQGFAALRHRFERA